MAWDEEQRKNAAIIQQVGKQLGASDRDILIALMTAAQESSLRNINYGDRDSIGLFQQRRPWGSDEQRMDPYESARMFFEGGHSGQPGLFSKKNRDSLSLTEAAQAVQVSAFPDAYAKHEGAAREFLGAAGTSIPGAYSQPATGASRPTGAAPKPGQEAAGFKTLESLEDDSSGFGVPFLPAMNLEDFAKTMGDAKLPGPFERPVAPVAADGMRKKVIDNAMQYIGQPYSWGNLDCSGLVQRAYAAVGVDLPRISYQQATYGRSIGRDVAKPGDLVAWDNSVRNNGADHIAIYLGNNQILEAPRTGLNVRIRNLDEDEQVWFVDMSRVTGG